MMIALRRRFEHTGTALSWNELALPIAFLVLCGALAIAHPRFATGINAENVSRQWAFLMILSVGQLYTILSGGIDLSLGAIVSVVSVITTMVVLQYGILPGVLAGIVVGAALGSANGLIIARLKISPMIGTLAMASFVAGLALTITGGMPVERVPPEFAVIGRGWLGPIPTPAALAGAIALLGYLVLRYTRFGRHLHAVGGSEETALLSSIDVDRMKVLIYGFAGLMAAICGIALSSLVVSGQARLGEGLEFQAIAAVALGGTKLGGGEGGVFRTVSGALFISVLANGLNLLNVPTYYQWLVVGASLIIALLLQRGRQA